MPRPHGRTALCNFSVSYFSLVMTTINQNRIYSEECVQVLKKLDIGNLRLNSNIFFCNSAILSIVFCVILIEPEALNSECL